MSHERQVTSIKGTLYVSIPHDIAERMGVGAGDRVEWRAVLLSGRGTYFYLDPRHQVDREAEL